MRVHLISGQWKAHKGIDFPAATGTPIRAAGDGVIDFAGTQNGYGNFVIIKHWANYTTAYAHMSRFANGIKKGSKVSQGDVIGYVGTTGWSTGAHLHYEFRVGGDARDPNTMNVQQQAPLTAAEMSRFKTYASDMAHRFALLQPGGSRGTRVAANKPVRLARHASSFAATAKHRSPRRPVFLYSCLAAWSGHAYPLTRNRKQTPHEFIYRPDVRHQHGWRGRRTGPHRCGWHRHAGRRLPGFPPALRAELMALQAAGNNEIEREALAANGLARVYADCVALLLEQSGQRRDAICAVAVHGQTIRHRPELGFTRQTNNPALLAELCGINVIADFRSRDVAAGGQGAPLVPAFHHALFSHPAQTRVVANIGGIANISILPGAGAGTAYAASTRAPATPCSTAGYSAIWGANMISTAPGAPLAS
jgi:hypothetical protein